MSDVCWKELVILLVSCDEREDFEERVCEQVMIFYFILISCWCHFSRQFYKFHSGFFSQFLYGYCPYDVCLVKGVLLQGHLVIL